MVLKIVTSILALIGAATVIIISGFILSEIVNKIKAQTRVKCKECGAKVKKHRDLFCWHCGDYLRDQERG